MGGFKDTFTKDEEQEGPQMYDDAAFYYFACSVLLTVVLPWTYFVISGLIWPDKSSVPGKSKQGSKVVHCKTSTMVEKQSTHAKSSGSGVAWGWWTQVIILGLLWISLFGVVNAMGGETEINRFDPFALLEVSSSASNAEIKKAYRKLSLVWHPDKNPNDPLAEARFIQITKAYAALTDETAKSNYEKYGNPDGPQTAKVGIGLPRFLLEKDNQLMILGLFFFFLLFLVPMTFICYYQRTKNYAGNGVLLETMHFMGYYINESTRVKNCPELLAASAESRDMPTKSSDNNDMKPLMQQVVEPTKRKFNHPVITKSCFLLGAHMQRLHDIMTPELRQDLDTLLKHSMKITQAMIEIACMREWFFTAQAIIEFRRCLVQGMDVKTNSLLQIPHFTEEVLKHCQRGKNAASSLPAFVNQPAEHRKGLADMSQQQLADVECFCSHLTDMEVKAVVSVEDEDQIVAGDIATVTVQMKRNNLQEGEAAGPVHAPLFPEPKYEEWWVFLVEGAPSTKIIAFERVKDPERFLEEKLRFPINRPGKYKMELHVICDSYAGLDKKVDITFTALSEEECKREIIVHKEDEDLDLQPTLFQQFMGDFGQEDEESEDEDDEKAKKEKKAAKPAAKKAGKSEEKAAKAASEDEDSSTKPDKEDAGDGSDSDSSDSSSDSD